MRISDWSSDVCSSDLGARTGRHVGLHGGVAEPQRPVARRFRRGTRPAARHGERQSEADLGAAERPARRRDAEDRSEEHTSELQSLMRISYAVFCLKKKKKQHKAETNSTTS